MPGVPGRSGGHNALSLQEHLLRGSFRRDRHARLTATPPSRRLAAADRRRTLAGLDGPARRLAVRLLAEYDGWNAAKLAVLKNFVLSSSRLDVLQQAPREDSRELHRELRGNLALLKALDLKD